MIKSLKLIFCHHAMRFILYSSTLSFHSLLHNISIMFLQLQFPRHCAQFHKLANIA
uniref:Uncharacterized protein n=1 Tax=Arundo donax TaxID=35708 RepID=A0A0A9HN54_ARUDO